jgi:hypothetical protein
MKEKKFKSLLFKEDLEEPVVELGRITYKSSGISLYLPKSIVQALRLTKEDRSLVIFSSGHGEFFLIKDTELAEALKSKILDLRRRVVEQNVAIIEK